MELQFVNKKPSEIVPYKDIFDSIQLKQTIVDLQNEVRELKQQLEIKNFKIEQLKKELKVLNQDNLEEKKEELIEQYTPSKKSIFSNGIIFILTLITSIFSRIEEIAGFISKYSPIPKDIFNYILFTILIFIPLRFIYKNLKQRVINQISQLITSPPLIQLFVDQLKENDKEDIFSESNVYNFIQRIQFPRNSLIRSMYKFLFSLKSPKVLNSLKDIFIYNLLSKQLIEISRADKLDRNFRIVKGFNHISLDDIF